MPYFVVVDDNFHYQDKDERYTHSRHDDPAAAIDCCRLIVDEFLAGSHKPDMSAEELYRMYTMFGDDPFVVSSDAAPVAFSAWDYARERCAVVCEVAAANGAVDAKRGSRTN